MEDRIVICCENVSSIFILHASETWKLLLIATDTCWIVGIYDLEQKRVFTGTWNIRGEVAEII